MSYLKLQALQLVGKVGKEKYWAHCPDVQRSLSCSERCWPATKLCKQPCSECQITSGGPGSGKENTRKTTLNAVDWIQTSKNMTASLQLLTSHSGEGSFVGRAPTVAVSLRGPGVWKTGANRVQRDCARAPVQELPVLRDVGRSHVRDIFRGREICERRFIGSLEIWQKKNRWTRNFTKKIREIGENARADVSCVARAPGCYVRTVTARCSWTHMTRWSGYLSAGGTEGCKNNSNFFCCSDSISTAKRKNVALRLLEVLFLPAWKTSPLVLKQARPDTGLLTKAMPSRLVPACNELAKRLLFANRKTWSWPWSQRLIDNGSCRNLYEHGDNKQR